MRPPYGVWSGAAASDAPLSERAAAASGRSCQHLEPALRQAGANAWPPPEASTACVGELTDYFRALAAERPLVLVLDEMQWADTTSWDALEHLLSQLDTDRILICLAHRPDSTYDTSSHRQMLGRHEITREITLSRLTRDEVKQWLEAAFHRQQVGREFLAFLYRHTEGNPLFIAQLLRALVEDGCDLAQRNAMGVEPGVGAARCRRAGRS